MESRRAGFRVMVRVQCLIGPAPLCVPEGGQLDMGGLGGG